MNKTDSMPLSMSVTKKEHMPPELREKYEAWLNRSSKNHPLYATTTGELMQSIDKNDIPLAPPEHPKTCTFTKTFIKPSSRLQRTTLDTTIEKHRFISALDPM